MITITITAATGQYGRLVIDELLKRECPRAASWRPPATPPRPPTWPTGASKSVRPTTTGPRPWYPPSPTPPRSSSYPAPCSGSGTPRCEAERRVRLVARGVHIDLDDVGFRWAL
jgi:hypothetical protein